MPPMPEIGSRASQVARDVGDHAQRDRLHRRAAIAAMRALPVHHRLRRHQVEIDAGDRLHGVDQRHRIRAARAAPPRPAPGCR